MTDLPLIINELIRFFETNNSKSWMIRLGCKIILNSDSGEIVKETSIRGLRHFLDLSLDSGTYMFVSMRESGNSFVSQLSLL